MNYQLTLPKPYLSHSQIECVMQSPKEYVKRYLYGKIGYTSKQQEFGKKITDILEGRVPCPKHLESALKNVPRYESTDVEIKCNLPSESLEITLLGKLDGKNKTLQGEYKTGMVSWTQERANKSLQLRIYALIEYTNTGKIPRQQLVWIPTVWNDTKIVLKGGCEIFEVRYTLNEINDTISIIWKAYNKIIKLTNEEYSKI